VKTGDRAWWTCAAALLGLLAPMACSDPDPHAFFRPQPAQRRPFVFAHRGGGGLLPENTLPAFQETVRRDPLAIVEFDVQRSRDGVLVVIHDGDVGRSTNGQGRVVDLTVAELQQLDAGFCATPGVGDGTAPRGSCDPAGSATTYPHRGKGFRIPTLAEVLAALPVTTFLSVEVKQQGIEQQFADVMRASGRLDHLATGAENDDIAVRVRDRLPEAAHFLPKGAATCLALAAKLRLHYPDCPRYDLFASPLTGAGLALDTSAVLDTAHGYGAQVIYWTINEPAELERLFRLGADGVYTDYPDRAREVAERLRAEGLWR
jgi:glycerophosphoryl diester phosphodiesterase